VTAEEQEGALSVLTILDLSEGVPGPYAAQLFAQHGAQVIKVERPGAGDVGRAWGIFHELNSGKLSLSLDYETEEGAAVLRRLAEDVDGIIEDQPTRRRAELGLGADELFGRISRLVIAQVSAFGADAPASGRLLTGLTLAAASGLLQPDATAEVDPGGVEKAVGLHVFVATLAGLWRAAQTEHGQVIEIAGVEALASTLGAPLARELAGVTRRTVQEPPTAGLFQAPVQSGTNDGASGLLPFVLSATPGSIADHAPALGEHTDYVLRDLIGFDAADIEALQAKGVI
jgi:crotonobetainyl-CoA:carnitine CoA-transferase CaiB-like acyl-CoA transferase